MQICHHILACPIYMIHPTPLQMTEYYISGNIIVFLVNCPTLNANSLEHVPLKVDGNEKREGKGMT
jgi:hypothetical protein